MNKSTRKAHAVNAPGLWSYARRLVHGFAEAGQPSATGLQLFVGPNGGLIWTDGAQVDRSEPYVGAVFSTAKKSPEPVETESTVIVRPEEPARHYLRVGELHLTAHDLERVQAQVDAVES
jgi:hypothetical protein